MYYVRTYIYLKKICFGLENFLFREMQVQFGLIRM